MLALAVCGMATVVRLDRERAFYATMVIVVASYYVLFAVMGGSTSALAAESVVLAAFAAGAVLAFKRGMWMAAVLLCAHGALDAVHARIITNPGVDAWWPPFCLAYDVVAGLYLGVLLHRRQGLASAHD